MSQKQLLQNQPHQSHISSHRSGQSVIFIGAIVVKDGVRTKPLPQARPTCIWHVWCFIKWAKTQLNSMAELGFVSQLEEKWLAVLRERGTSLASAKSSLKLCGPRSNISCLLSSLTTVMYYTAVLPASHIFLYSRRFDKQTKKKSLPALRREGMATQRTRSSRSRHCLAIRMATKVANESWKDKSLTWRMRERETEISFFFSN